MMTSDLYRFRFNADLPVDEIEDTLALAVIATEGLHGESQTLLDAGHAYDPAARSCVIDASSDVGRDLNRLFAGFLRREFGPNSFWIERLHRDVHRNPPFAAEPAVN
jgi:hypothetical protein